MSPNIPVNCSELIPSALASFMAVAVVEMCYLSFSNKIGGVSFGWKTTHHLQSIGRKMIHRPIAHGLPMRQSSY